MWCSKCNAEVICGYIVADTLDDLHELGRIERRAADQRPVDEAEADETKLPWSVVVQKLDENSFRTVFQVGVQHFVLACVENNDEAEQHCNFIAKMFRKAMSRAGE